MTIQLRVWQSPKQLVSLLYESSHCVKLYARSPYQCILFCFWNKTLSLWLFLLKRKRGNILKDTTKTLKCQGMLLWRSSCPTPQFEQDDLKPVAQCVPVTFVRWLGTTDTSLALSFLHPSLHIYVHWLVSLPIFFRPNRPSSLSPSSWERCSSPFNTTHHWTLSRWASVSLTQYPRCDLASAE